MPTPTPYAGPTPEELAAIPVALTQRNQFILWRGADRVVPATGEVALNKIPINPHTLTNADTTDPGTWGSFYECRVALPVALEEWELDDPAGYRGGGLGYVFSHDDPYTGIDLDHCISEVTGIIADWAQQYAFFLDSYTEKSPSGTGLHVIVEASLPPKGRKSGNVEMYDNARFFTLTGRTIPRYAATLESRQPQLNTLWCQFFGAKVGEYVWLLDANDNLTNHDGKPWAITGLQPSPLGEPYAFFAETVTGWPLAACEVTSAVPAQATPPVEDNALMVLMKSAANRAKLQELSTGHWQHDYASQSEADLALCCMLAFWTQDPAQLDRLFRSTAMMRAKWDEKRGAQTYGERTIAEALARQTEHYT